MRRFSIRLYFFHVYYLGTPSFINRFGRFYLCLKAYSYEVFPLKFGEDLMKNFGDIQWNSSMENSKLLAIAVPLWKASNKVCKSEYPISRTLQRGYDNTTQMCYGDERGKALEICSEGSKGHLQIKSKNIYCMYLILGMTSFIHCGGAVPAIYTRVSYYVPWIESIVWP